MDGIQQFNYFTELKACILGIALITVSTGSVSQSWKQYPYQPEGSLIAFPSDEGRHNSEPIEWWYTAGHLEGKNSGIQYSFMLTYFYYPAYGFDGFRIMNLSNDDTGQFYPETVAVGYNIMAEDSLNIEASTMDDKLEYWRNIRGPDEKAIPFEYTLYAESNSGTLNLDYVSEKPPLILGGDGYFKQGSASYTYYYSLTKSIVTGSLEINGASEEVSGTAWIDRQYGSFNPLTEEDYEWYFIQLSNGMDLNIYDIFSKDRRLPDSAEYKHMAVYVDTATQFTTHEFNIERLSFHYMSDSIMCYSNKWRLSAPGHEIDLTIETLHADSEVKLPFRFFEGSTYVVGTVAGANVTGRGFAELLHSYERPEIDISYPAGAYWNASRPVSWMLLNPDDGRPVKYNLEYSIDNKETFEPIAMDLLDPFYYWEDPPLYKGSNCWFRVTAFSIDSTLINRVESLEASSFDPDITALDPGNAKNDHAYHFNIYPNPALDVLYIDIENGSLFSIYEIRDVTGRLMLYGQVPGDKFQIDLSVLNPGLYLMGFHYREGIYSSSIIVR